jgi:hypothetical protein
VLSGRVRNRRSHSWRTRRCAGIQGNSTGTVPKSRPLANLRRKWRSRGQGHQARGRVELPPKKSRVPDCPARGPRPASGHEHHLDCAVVGHGELGQSQACRAEAFALLRPAGRSARPEKRTDAGAGNLVLFHRRLGCVAGERTGCQRLRNGPSALRVCLRIRRDATVRVSGGGIQAHCSREEAGDSAALRHTHLARACSARQLRSGSRALEFYSEQLSLRVTGYSRRHSGHVIGDVKGPLALLRMSGTVAGAAQLLLGRPYVQAPAICGAHAGEFLELELHVVIRSGGSGGLLATGQTGGRDQSDQSDCAHDKVL